MRRIVKLRLSTLLFAVLIFGNAPLLRADWYQHGDVGDHAPALGDLALVTLTVFEITDGSSTASLLRPQIDLGFSTLPDVRFENLSDDRLRENFDGTDAIVQFELESMKARQRARPPRTTKQSDNPFRLVTYKTVESKSSQKSFKFLWMPENRELLLEHVQSTSRSIDSENLASGANSSGAKNPIFPRVLTAISTLILVTVVVFSALRLRNPTGW
jgi:hypothetical protein